MTLYFTSSTAVLLASAVAPALGLVGCVKTWVWWRNRRPIRSPFAEKLLRPAGESLRLKGVELDEEINLHMICIFFVPPLFIAALLVQKADTITFVVVAVVLAVFFVVFTRRLLQLGVRKR